MRRFVLVLVLLCSASAAHAKNVILFIGDGMGINYITAARFYQDGSGKKPLFIDSLPVAGLVRTHSTDFIVTDSGAAATAMATGRKTGNECIGLGPDCKRGKPYVSIAQQAADAGMATGVVTTTRITHATPAAFYAHVRDREQEMLIARQLFESKTQVALGGGKKFFTPQMLASGTMQPVLTTKELQQAQPGTRVVGLFADGHIPYVLERKQQKYSGPDLPQMTKEAIRLLSANPNGYFLMVEGGRIDHAGHDNRTRDALEETLEFDRAVRMAAQITNPEETLILVTADHETGGFALNGYPKLGANILSPSAMSWSTGPGSCVGKPEISDHTAVDVPLFGSGLPEGYVARVMDNTDIYTLMHAALFP